MTVYVDDMLREAQVGRLRSRWGGCPGRGGGLMALSRFRAQNHPQQSSRRWPDDVDGVDDRATHPLDFAEFDERHGPFTVDVAAAAHNTKCERYYDREADGLAQDWAGERVWCNPPYSSIAPWVRKAWECLRFLAPGQTAVGPNQRPPFGCVVLRWDTGVDATPIGHLVESIELARRGRPRLKVVRGHPSSQVVITGDASGFQDAVSVLLDEPEEA